MKGFPSWVIGLAGSSAFVGLMILGALLVLASKFVNEFTHSHVKLDETEFTWGMPEGETEPPAAFRRPLSIQTCDGKRLQGEFWTQPHPAPTIILCHGFRVPRHHLHPVAALEYRSGYNILLFDFRGHGQSARAVTSGGIAEVRDLEAALKVARQQPETLPGKVILHGFSMGASVALLLPPQLDVAAIIADSPYARLDAILRRLVHYRLTTGTLSWPPCLRWLRSAIPALSWAAVAVSRPLFRLRFGHALIARPDRRFEWGRRSAQAGLPLHTTPILFIHSADDPLIPVSHAQRLAALAQAYGVPLETYYVEHATHCGAYGSNPGRYVTLLQQFLALHVKDEASPPSTAFRTDHLKDREVTPSIREALSTIHP